MLGRFMMRVVRLSCLPLVLIELLFFPFMCGAAGLGGIFVIIVMVRGLVVMVFIMRARVAVILMVRLLIRGRRGFLLIGLVVLLMVAFFC
jgi:hypothetical protein